MRPARTGPQANKYECGGGVTSADRATSQSTPRLSSTSHGAIAQLGEHRLCKPGVAGSSPAGSTVQLKNPPLESMIPNGGFFAF